MELARTGIYSGEGSMLAEEQAENSCYFYELASAQFGWTLNLVEKVWALNLKGGQDANAGAGGHLPREKVEGKIAEARGLTPGQSVIFPETFIDLQTPSDLQKLDDALRERPVVIPIGFILFANHIEHDIDIALEAGADYIILDGRGGGTGGVPLIFCDHISVPAIPALARARKNLHAKTGREISLVITGGLWVAEDFFKAKVLGTDAIVVSNSAMQAAGCVATRMCNSNNCPVNVATQKFEFRKRLNVQVGAELLARYFWASVTLMLVLVRAFGHDSLNQLASRDITTWHREMAHLSAVSFPDFVKAP
jgi:glutamate synthase domain-containing protein 2